jgi:hypothetical protein
MNGKNLGFDGKTVKSCTYIDAYDGGLMIIFTDRQVPSVEERMQAGQLRVFSNGALVEAPDYE